MKAKIYFGNHFSSQMLEPSIQEVVDIRPFENKVVHASQYSYVGCDLFGTQEVLCPEGSIHLDADEVLIIHYVDESLQDGKSPLATTITSRGMMITLPR